jgi:hypothetical protein
MIYLPKELIEEIIKYKIGRCEECNIEKDFRELKRNIVLQEYGTIYGLRYVKERKYYEMVCINCIDEKYHLCENIIKIKY